jgi:hypothetical protein
MLPSNCDPENPTQNRLFLYFGPGWSPENAAEEELLGFRECGSLTRPSSNTLVPIPHHLGNRANGCGFLLFLLFRRELWG